MDKKEGNPKVEQKPDKLEVPGTDEITQLIRRRSETKKEAEEEIANYWNAYGDDMGY